MYDKDLDLTHAVAEAADWLRETGERNEDGEVVVLATWYVWLTLTNGRRFCLDHSFAPRIEHDEEGWPHVVGEDAAKAAARRVAAKVQAAILMEQPVDIENRWTEIQPAYGSEWYQRSNAEEELIWAEKNDELYPM